MNSIAVSQTSLLRTIIAALGLDFAGAPWTTCRGTICDKQTKRLLVDRAVGGPMTPAVHYGSIWTPIHIFHVNTRRHGILKLPVSKEMYDCMNLWDSMPIDVKSSRLYPDRCRIRVAR